MDARDVQQSERRSPKETRKSYSLQGESASAAQAPLTGANPESSQSPGSAAINGNHERSSGSSHPPSGFGDQDIGR